ncbi:hypothetical protein GCM10009765_58360 [Fodinicola feengrottensis]|uniref:DNA-binding transcriptional regulator of glucitol operon n=1 Tax=Fodinicola feengrottensis TaxID=435914 RepID=A0ABN2IAF8_9ACTN
MAPVRLFDVRQVMFSRRWLWKHVAALVLLAICVGGAWWQWYRAGSPTGTLQNAGYALEWPLFAIFVVWAWFRMMQLEARQLAKPAEPVATAEPEPAPVVRPPVLVKAGSAAPADDDDQELARYNDYLARLAAEDD